jgi:hypothetical protein
MHTQKLFGLVTALVLTLLTALWQPVMGQSAPCTNCTLYNGSLSGIGDYNFQPNGTYYQSTTSGYHQGWLRGPAQADFGLALLRYSGSGSDWDLIETAFTFGGGEPIQISHNGPAGYYLWVVYSVSGSGAYNFWLQKPGGTSTPPSTAFTLTATPSEVAPGGTVTVSWTAPEGRPTDDWIGLYAVGNDDYRYLTYKYTGGRSSGSLDFTLPTQTIQYEFRYFKANRYDFAARSNTVQVVNSGGKAEIEEFSYLGKDVDFVSGCCNAGPDGQMDGHFRVRLNLPGSNNWEIKSIGIFGTDANGNKLGTAWHTQNTGNWVLGVRTGEYSGLLAPPQKPTLGQFVPGRRSIDLYLTDGGWLRSGGYFSVEVVLGNGETLKKLVRLP